MYRLYRYVAKIASLGIEDIYTNHYEKWSLQYIE